MKEEENKTMGIPNMLANKEAVFPRTFRFILESKTYPELYNLVQKIELELFLRNFTVYLLEVTVDGLTHPHQYLDKIMAQDFKDELTLVAMDGLGETLYAMRFDGVSAFDHHVEYDYSRSDAVVHRIGFDYESMSRIEPSKASGKKAKSTRPKFYSTPSRKKS